MGEQLIKCYAVSLPNESYHYNQDNLYMNGKYIINEQKNDDFSYSCSYREPIQIYAVSDGLGYGEKGAIPSTAVMQILKVLQKRLMEDENLSIQTARKMIRDFVVDTNNKICLYKDQVEDQNVGTTFAAVFLFGNKAFTVHVGDSRVYLFKNDRLLQITQDHLECNSLVKLGIINEEQAEVHKIRSKVTKYFGFDDEEYRLSASFSEVFNVYPGDIIFLTTDGITDGMGNDDIKGIIEKNNKDEVLLGKEIINHVKHQDTDRTLIMLNIDEVVKDTIIREKESSSFASQISLPKVNLDTEDKKKYAIYGGIGVACLLVLFLIISGVNSLLGTEEAEPAAKPPVVEEQEKDNILENVMPPVEEEDTTEMEEETTTTPPEEESVEESEEGSEVVAENTIPTDYVVQSGDNLYQIAMALFDDPAAVQKIAYINNLEDPGNIFVGQKLLLPVEDGSIEYKVQPGDTVFSISMKFFGTNSKEEEIMKINNIADVNNLVSGTKIQIP